MQLIKQQDNKCAVKFFSDERGMTLLDIAIGLLVISLLITPSLYALKEYRINRAKNVTEENLRDIDKAIRDYFVANDHYPCPANPTLDQSHADHGASLVSGGDCTIQNVSGLAEGSVPHTELGLDIKKVYDGWGSKILYAVDNSRAGNTATGPLTVAANPITISEIPLVPNPALPAAPPVCAPNQFVCANAITGYVPGANPACNPAFTNPPSPQIANNVHYTLLSHGEDGFGAYSRTGQLRSTVACDDTVAVDQENCDGDAVYQTRQCMNTSLDTAAYYDDYTVTAALQKVSNPNDMLSQSNANNNGIAVGVEYVGIRNSDPRRELDVTGNIMVSDIAGNSGDDKDGSIRAYDYCDTSGSDCFDATLIGGSDLVSPCPSGTTIVGISNNGADCESVLSGSLGAISCPNGVQSIIGGTVTCVP